MRVALTFDTEEGDRPHHSMQEVGWSRILDLLDANGIRASFFLIGEWAARQPDLVRRTAEAGHLIGNHTMHHIDLRGHPEQLADQVSMAEAVIRAIVPDRQVRPWFRLPFLSGAGDDGVLAGLDAAGYEHVKDNADSGDWDDGWFPTAESVAGNVITESAGADPVVVLMHSWPRTTPDAVAILIEHFRGLDAEFVTVDELTAEERAALPSRA